MRKKKPRQAGIALPRFPFAPAGGVSIKQVLRGRPQMGLENLFLPDAITFSIYGATRLPLSQLPRPALAPPPALADVGQVVIVVVGRVAITSSKDAASATSRMRDQGEAVEISDSTGRATQCLNGVSFESGLGSDREFGVH